MNVKISKATFRHVEQELQSYHLTLREIEKLRSQIMYDKSNVDENIGGSRSSSPGDPTGRMAIALVTNRKLDHMRMITTAIEQVHLGLTDTQKQLIKLRYWTRPQTLTWEGIALQLHVSRAQAIRWRNAIVVAVATQLGWR